MGLEGKSLLLVSEDVELGARLESALKPLVKSCTLVQSAQDAIRRVSNQDFDCILLRTLRPSLDSPTHLFRWCQANKSKKKIPWVILGKDIEDEQILVTQNHVKFLEKTDDIEALKTLLGGIFFTPAAGATAPTLDVNFINPVVVAVTQVISSMAQIELTRGAPYIRKPGESAEAIWDVSGVIAMNSDRFLGSMAFCFEQKLILKIFANMLGTPAETITDDVKDAVSEITNIVFGNAKRDLNAAGHSIAPALPSVISGPKHEIRHNVSGVRFCIPFTSEHGRMLAECVVSMKAPTT